MLQKLGWEVRNLGCMNGGFELLHQIDDVLDRLPREHSEDAKDGLIFLAHGVTDRASFVGNDGVLTSYDEIVAHLDHRKFADKPKIVICSP